MGKESRARFFICLLLRYSSCNSQVWKYHSYYIEVKYAWKQETRIILSKGLFTSTKNLKGNQNVPLILSVPLISFKSFMHDKISKLVVRGVAKSFVYTWCITGHMTITLMQAFTWAESLTLACLSKPCFFILFLSFLKGHFCIPSTFITSYIHIKILWHHNSPNIVILKVSNAPKVSSCLL